MKRLLTVMLATVCTVSFAACAESQKEEEKVVEPSSSSIVSETSETQNDNSEESSSENSEKTKELTVEKVGIDLNKGGTYAVVLYENGTKTLNSSYVWKSDKPEIADVSSNGVITANSGGYATVTVSDSKDPTIFAQVSVHVPTEKSEETGGTEENSGNLTIINNIPAPQQSSTPESSYVPQVDYPSFTPTHFNKYNLEDGSRAYYYVSNEIPDYDLLNFSKEEAQFLINVLAAKHGFRFKTDEKEVFKRFAWYNQISPSDYYYESEEFDNRATPVEQRNNANLMKIVKG